MIFKYATDNSFNLILDERFINTSEEGLINFTERSNGIDDLRLKRYYNKGNTTEYYLNLL